MVKVAQSSNCGVVTMGNFAKCIAFSDCIKLCLSEFDKIFEILLRQFECIAFKFKFFKINKTIRVEWFTEVPGFEMQMAASRMSCVSTKPNEFSSFNFLIGVNKNFR